MKDKMTAVEWLAEQIITIKWKMSDVTDRNSIIEQAKQMEQAQKQQAYNDGCDDACEMFYQMSKS